jgi:hypothetical protein
MLAEPFKSDCGYVAGRKGIVTLQEADLCPPAMVCGFGVAADMEPQICVPANTAADCEAAIGQIFVQQATGRTRLVDHQAHCCWSNNKVIAFAERVENIFASMPVGSGLEARAARRFRQELVKRHSAMIGNVATPNGFTGYHLLETVNKATLVSSFDVKIARVRDRILFEIERRFTFKSPDPCAPGVYCYRGTCADMTPIDSSTVQR